jgi:hypothetical protein
MKVNLVVCQTEQEALAFISSIYFVFRHEYSGIRLYSAYNDHHCSYIAYNLDDDIERNYVKQAIKKDNHTVGRIIFYNSTNIEDEWKTFEQPIIKLFGTTINRNDGIIRIKSIMLGGDGFDLLVTPQSISSLSNKMKF